MKMMLRGGPHADTELNGDDEDHKILRLWDDKPGYYHEYRQGRWNAKTGHWEYQYAGKYSALGRDPGHGGYFVPPAWL